MFLSGPKQGCLQARIELDYDVFVDRGRGSQVVRQGSAKASFTSSILVPASNSILLFTSAKKLPQKGLMMGCMSS